jgi:DnaD/phage-associated family protein
MTHYWIKLYHEVLHDPKIGQINDRLFTCMIKLFLLAGENGEKGLLPSVKDMAWVLRMDAHELEDVLHELSALEIVSDTPEGWVVTHFKSRQAAFTSTQRVRAFRKKRASDLNASQGSLPVEKNDETENETAAAAVKRSDSISASASAFESESVSFSASKSFGEGGFPEDPGLPVRLDQGQEGDTGLQGQPERELAGVDPQPAAGNPRPTRQRARHRKAKVPVPVAVASPGQKNRDSSTTGHGIRDPSPGESVRDFATGKTIQDFAAEACQVFEDNMGEMGPLLVEALQADVIEYGQEWVIEAIREAIRSNGKSIKYVEAILQRWKQEGRQVRKDESTGSPRKKYISGKFADFIN